MPWSLPAADAHNVKSRSGIVYFAIGAIVASISIFACQWGVTRFRNSETRPKQYLRYHFHGGWGTDGDLWINANDEWSSRVYDNASGAIENEKAGKRNGLYASIVKIVDDKKGWEMRTDSLREERENSPEAVGVSVFDGTHSFIEFRTDKGVLLADFYEPESFAKIIPRAVQIHAFADIVSAMQNVMWDR